MKRLLSVLLIAILSSGCGGSCEQEAESYRTKECAIAVQSTDFNGRWFKLKGINLISGEADSYSDQGGWYLFFKDKIDIGDTVIKRRNELVFSIHKNGTAVSFPFECEGKIYR